MARITKTGGVVSACVWDHENCASSLLWQGARAIDPMAPGEAEQPGTKRGDLARLFRLAGMQPDADSVLSVNHEFATFEDLWEPFTLGVGRAGGYVAGLGRPTRQRLQGRVPGPDSRRPVCAHPSSVGSTR